MVHREFDSPSLSQKEGCREAGEQLIGDILVWGDDDAAATGESRPSLAASPNP